VMVQVVVVHVKVLVGIMFSLVCSGWCDTLIM